jgi:(1->4)-alpha-D-glucan 1-alpha-D-glucosylmutase
VCSAARRHGMGVLADIVPNHMGVSVPRANPWWWSVLAEGRGSPYAAAFDIDWDAAGGRIRIPVVGDGDLLPDGRIDHLSVVDGELRYHEHRFPLRYGDGEDGGDPDAVHARQHYELVGWRRADHELNYRRFFAVSDLAGVRVEDPAWFDATHVEVARWFSEGLVDGLRIDHPDGLVDPDGYLRRLTELTGGAYVLVEKILHHEEPLPPSWQCSGTTGYDALGQVERVLVDPAGREPLEAAAGSAGGWRDLVHDRKRAIADGILGSEVRRVVRELGSTIPAAGAAIGEEDPVLVDAVAEVAACFPVYRSYLPAGLEVLQHALTEARRRRPDLDEALDRIEPVLADAGNPAALRFQQTTGAVMAKGVEDTAFFRYNRLTSLNEVGGDPDVFSISVADFHEAMALRYAQWPHGMTTLSTHDTKRGEDTRARITVLAEVPELWSTAFEELLRRCPGTGRGFGALLWQAIVGAWRDDDRDLRQRLHAYAEKAMREAAEHTTWSDPDQAYERGVHAAVDAAFDDPEVARILRRVLAAVVDPGWSNALSAKLVQLTMPGVPDVYQGSELWEQSLVDPDNRRPVDFTRRVSLLDQVPRGRAEVPRPIGIDDPGHAKLLVTATALRLRRERPELFTSYDAVDSEGDAAAHVLAFDRGGAVTVATRLPLGLERRGGWGDTRLRLDGRWCDVVTGRTHDAQPRLDALLDHLPVALLVREDA